MRVVLMYGMLKAMHMHTMNAGFIHGCMSIRYRIAFCLVGWLVFFWLVGGLGVASVLGSSLARKTCNQLIVGGGMLVLLHSAGLLEAQYRGTAICGSRVTGIGLRQYSDTDMPRLHGFWYCAAG
jgi:hypothetical protein